MRFGEQVGAYQIDDLPGCTQVGVSHASYIKPRFRGLGYGNTVHRGRLKRAKDLGYDALIATVDDSNIPQIKIMEKNGWKKVETFLSSKTDHSVSIWVVKLQQ